MLLYKYRTIDNLRYFVDIILNERLYAAQYFDMNDPMEGQYMYSLGVPPDKVIQGIKGEKQKLRIVSLSRDPNNTLMWSHYANGHSGVAIGVDVNRKKYDVREVLYRDNLFNLEYHDEYINLNVAKNILSHKLSAWSYENEERIFVEDGKHFAYVEVKEIILGSKMSNQDQGFIRNLVSKINSNVSVKRTSDYGV